MKNNGHSSCLNDSEQNRQYLPQLFVKFNKKPHTITRKRAAPSSVLFICLESTLRITGIPFSLSTAIRPASDKKKGGKNLYQPVGLYVKLL